MGQSTARHSGFPLGVLLMLVLFLLLQDRIDRRDPKLTLAPGHADPDLPFDEPPLRQLSPHHSTESHR
jgi:hypothetical protein